MNPRYLMDTRIPTALAVAFCAIAATLPSATLAQPQPKIDSPDQHDMLTSWGAKVTPDNAWREYPRPQMVREDWMCLNGLWDLTIVGADGPWQAGRVENATYDPLLDELPEQPDRWEHKILVPFSPETQLSGVRKNVRPNQLLWYHRTFTVPGDWADRRIMLHFEAVDWHAVVLLNGVKVGENKGGYVPLSCDLSDALNADGRQELVVVAWDPTNMGDQTIGKQALPELRRGFRYTPNSGIWQSVWLEPVAKQVCINDLKITPDAAGRSVALTVNLDDATDDDTAGLTVRVTAKNDVTAPVASETSGESQDTDAVQVTGKPGEPICLILGEDYKLWSPDHPVLHDLRIELCRGAEVIDSVDSYFALRNIDLAPDSAGINRIRLNGEPIFQFGPLDQGYWPGGALTPPSEEAVRYDLQYLKDIGCNMIRVHIKVHPRRWYFEADRLGLLVWQDFVCSRKFEPAISPASAEQWELEQRRMMDHLHNHPSVVTWVVFNEGWGQYDTQRLTEWTMSYDPSRLVTGASGWTDFPVGHIYDNHDYSFNISPAHGLNFSDRATLCGECGGVNVLLPGHLWHKDQTQTTRVNVAGDGGRENYESVAQWQPRYKTALTNLRLMQPLGLNAAVYTQISDVEHECNGWLTYDRKVSKFPVEQLGAWHRKLYEPIRTRAVWSLTAGVAAHFRGNLPPSWAQNDFDDAGWEPIGPAAADQLKPLVILGDGLGPLHLRARFTLESIPENLALHTVGPGQWDLSINGVQVMSITSSDRAGFVPYSTVQLPDAALAQLVRGQNIVAMKLSGGRRDGPKPALYDFGLLTEVQ